MIVAVAVGQGPSVGPLPGSSPGPSPVAVEPVASTTATALATARAATDRPAPRFDAELARLTAAAGTAGAPPASPDKSAPDTAAGPLPTVDISSHPAAPPPSGRPPPSGGAPLTLSLAVPSPDPGDQQTTARPGRLSTAPDRRPDAPPPDSSAPGNPASAPADPSGGIPAQAAILAAPPLATAVSEGSAAGSAAGDTRPTATARHPVPARPVAAPIPTRAPDARTPGAGTSVGPIEPSASAAIPPAPDQSADDANTRVPASFDSRARPGPPAPTASRSGDPPSAAEPPRALAPVATGPAIPDVPRANPPLADAPLATPPQVEAQAPPIATAQSGAANATHAAVAGSAPGTTPVNALSIPATQIANALFSANLTADGTHRLTVQLRPAELGQVQVVVDRSADGSTRIAVLADRAQTLELLGRDQAALRHALASAGLTAPQDIAFSVRAEPTAGSSGAALSFGQESGARGFQPARSEPPPSQEHVSTRDLAGTAAPSPAPAKRGALDLIA